MNSKTFSAAMALVGLFLTPARIISQDSLAGAKIEVHMHYAGAGKVDEKHKIFVALWDSTDFMKGGESAPVAMATTATKDGTVVFENVKKSPAYLTSLYDPKGEWDAASAPPDGSVVGMYSTNPGEPAPIEVKSGKSTTVEFTFDDTVTMNGGQPQVK